MTDAPETPAGPFQALESYDETARKNYTRELASAPERLRDAVSGLTDEQLDTRYRNWTIRQITHHVADSHVHSYIRFKWTLTEDTPTIKAYEEADWVALADSSRGDVEPSLSLLDGLHGKWVQLLEVMGGDDFERAFVHPQTGETVRLWTALGYYPWHARHHTAQILWLREQHGW